MHLPLATSAVGVFLFLLLAFTTATVFVPASWPLQSFQIGIYALMAICCLVPLQGQEESRSWIRAGALLYLVPLWGALQIALNSTSSSYATRKEVLRWGALICVFALSKFVSRKERTRQIALSCILGFGIAIAILCLLQLFTSHGNVLWIFSSGYPDVYGTFQNYDNFAQFIEIILPIALWRSVRQGWHAWWNLLAGGVLYASVIGSASRAGAVLCTLEILIILVAGYQRRRGWGVGRPMHHHSGVLLVIPAVAMVFTIAVGWQHVMQRFEVPDPFQARREFLIASIQMVEAHPLMGLGLGTFPETYQRFAIRDFPFYANHAHNDWAEFAAEGGLPFLLLIAFPLLRILPAIRHNLWCLGLAMVMIHACVDFPFPRPAVSGWIFAMLGILYMAHDEDLQRDRARDETGNC